MYSSDKYYFYKLETLANNLCRIFAITLVSYTTIFINILLILIRLISVLSEVNVYKDNVNY